jgi:enterochelin esterase family protein
MKLVRRLTLLLSLGILVHAQGVTGQAPPPLSFGVPIERAVRSGEVHEYAFTAGAGDLISGTLTLPALAALVEIADNTGQIIQTTYRFDDGSDPLRLGFVAPAAGVHRLRIKAFDRFDGGGQITPGKPIPVTGTAAGRYTLRLETASVSARMQGPERPVREDYSSARLKRLAEDVKTGRVGAVQAFWQEVAGKGPLVEDIAGNDRDADVTFLWRETYDTRNVLLMWSYEDYMSRLSGTNVWYKTVRLRRGTRLPYRISPNDRPATRQATIQLDPLNLRKSPDDPTIPFLAASVLDMAGAPDEQWALRTPVRRGLIEERTVKSALLKNPVFKDERPIWIYTPPGYDRTAGPYPLLVLLDGAAWVSNRFGNAPATLDNLINDGRIRPAIVLFDPGNRPAGAAGHAGYGEALVREVMPMLRAAYPISTNPADTVIGGYSAGGTAAAQIALLHSDVFGNVLSQSGAFRNREPGDEEPNATARKYLAESRRPIRFYLETGLYDNVPSANLPLYEMVLDETNLMGNRHLRDVLRAKGYDVTYREVGGGHDYVHWRAMLADGLMTLLKR